MKKFLSLGLALMFTGAALTSCNNDDPDLYYSYGTVMPQESGKPLQIRKDAGAYLTFDNNNNYGLTAGQRLIITYEVVGSLNEGGDNTIVPWSSYSILTKDPVLGSTLTDNAEEETKLGSDAMLDIDPWLGGEYLNIDFLSYFGAYSYHKHFINLVADDAAFEADPTNLKLTLRYNAYGDVPNNGRPLVFYDGVVSFNLVDLYEELGIETDQSGKYVNSPKITLEWEEYKGNTANTEVKTQVMGQFQPWTVELPATASSTVGTNAQIE